MLTISSAGQVYFVLYCDLEIIVNYATEGEDTP